ncbi:choice-of-anchor J domain-containing protein [Mangrovimonas sp. ST2L15]|uniref:choice-of-anchor J domain-containing protein n=1 Tax=Mangrovimonas sp. ST2L15 TaxID=1645916 RepID=UPI0006B5FBB0|nr:choice-of-anchor J domain-containing protein [Mangrovimonas sp. ST2L15]
MKRIINALMIVGLVLVGCNPMEDIHNDIDSVDNPVVGSAEYTLTDEDYEELELGFGSFDSEDQAKELIPGLLADMYPYWGAGSSVLVGYNLYIGNAEGVSDYTGAEVYELTTADYATTGSDAFGFYPDTNATEAIIDILGTQIANPVEGQMVLATYNHYTETPDVGLAVIEEFHFNGDLEGFETINVLGDQIWETASFGGVEYAFMSGYDGGAQDNEDWLISTPIDLDGESDIRFQINQAINYASDLGLLTILVSSDYSGDPAAATWEEITLANAPEGNNWTFVLSEDYDLSAYDGEIINVAFKYESNTSEAASWEIDQVLIKALGVSGDYDSKGEYFVYTTDGWESAEGVYYLSSADYDSMGTASGQPGQYNNFSSSVPADSYIPTFLSITYPYAQEEDQMIVIYKYYSSSAGAVQTRGNLYTVIDGMWTPHETTVATTLQFGHDGVEWVPDNTIQYTLTASDYDYVATTYASVSGFESAAGNLATYGNFNRTGGSSGWTDDMMITVLTDLLGNVIAPSAEEGQKYVLSYDIYNGSSAVESFAFIKEGGEWILN